MPHLSVLKMWSTLKRFCMQTTKDTTVTVSDTLIFLNKMCLLNTIPLEVSLGQGQSSCGQCDLKGLDPMNIHSKYM